MKTILLALLLVFSSSALADVFTVSNDQKGVIQLTEDPGYSYYVQGTCSISKGDRIEITKDTSNDTYWIRNVSTGESCYIFTM